MTASDPARPAPNPVAAPDSLPRRYGDARYGMSLVAVVVGTYALISAPAAQIAQLVLSRQLDALPLIAGQIAFAAALLLFGVLVAPTSGIRRGIAAAVVVVALLLVTISQPMIITGALRIPAPGSFLLGGAFLYTLAAAAAWLTIRERVGVSYVFLLAILVIPFAIYGVVLAGSPTGVTVPVQNVLVTVIGVGIAWAGWAVSRGRRPAHPRP